MRGTCRTQYNYVGLLLLPEGRSTRYNFHRLCARRYCPYRNVVVVIGSASATNCVHDLRLGDFTSLCEAAAMIAFSAHTMSRILPVHRRPSVSRAHFALEQCAVYGRPLFTSIAGIFGISRLPASTTLSAPDERNLLDTHHYPLFTVP